ncbi:MAG: segregation/condensation protein A [Firmicutes bacterium]|nr:segregation/condensation protein A [Bacillota bacterium]
MDYQVQLDVFEGPLDLLLHLIGQEKLDIHDIEIAVITQQYLDYLATMQEFDLEITGDFLVMAATLLQLKADALLPMPGKQSEDDEEDAIYSREDLVRRLLILSQYKDAAGWLNRQAKASGLSWTRPFSTLGPPGPNLYENPIGKATVLNLALALREALTSKREREQIHEIQAKEVNIEVKIDQIISLIQRRSQATFHSLLGSAPTRTEVIVIFLAVLELARLGKVQVEQKVLLGPIAIKATKFLEKSV